MKKRVKLICIVLSLLMIVTDIPYNFFNYDQNVTISVAKKKKKKAYYVYKDPYYSYDLKYKKKFINNPPVWATKKSKPFLKYVHENPDGEYARFEYRGTDEVVYVPINCCVYSFAENLGFNPYVKKIVFDNGSMISYGSARYFKPEGDNNVYCSLYQCVNLERIEQYYGTEGICGYAVGNALPDFLEPCFSTVDGSGYYQFINFDKAYCLWKRGQRVPLGTYIPMDEV